MGDANVTARVTFLGKFTGEEFVEFSAENTVGDELASFADLGRHLEVTSLWRRKISPKTSSQSQDSHPSQRAMLPRRKYVQTSSMHRGYRDTNLVECEFLTPGVVLSSTPVDMCSSW